MARKRKYCTKLTKEELVRRGITNVTEDGVVFYNGKVKRPTIGRHVGKVSGYVKTYPIIVLVDKDVKKERKTKYTKKDGTISYHKGWVYGTVAYPVGRLMLAWFLGEVPENMDCDHKDSNPWNNRFSYNPEDSNLQLLTRRENLAKRFIDNPNCSTNQYTWLKKHQ